MTDLPDATELLERMTYGLRCLIADRPIERMAMVGVHTGGVWLAEHLHTALGLSTPLGRLNINFYRDDFSRIGVHPRVLPSELPFEVEGREILLVDDVLYTGRTVRAALNELFDYGRPAAVRLAVLVTRNGHELPVSADVAGTAITLGSDQAVHLSGPVPLTVDIEQRPS